MTVGFERNLNDEERNFYKTNWRKRTTKIWI